MVAASNLDYFGILLVLCFIGWSDARFGLFIKVALIAFLLVSKQTSWLPWLQHNAASGRNQRFTRIAQMLWGNTIQRMTAPPKLQSVGVSPPPPLLPNRT